MGTYLATGIAQKIVIQKREIRTPNLTAEDFIPALEKEVNLEHYVFGENDEEFFWEIKPQMLFEGNLPEFLSDQFEIYEGVEEKDKQELIEKIKKAKSAEEIIEIAENHEYNFQMIKIRDFLQVEKSFRGETVHYFMIAFFLDGKIIMECYNNIFHYFERNIRLQEAKYPLASCVKVMITD